MKRTDRLKQKMTVLYTLEELDKIAEEEGYYPLEDDSEEVQHALVYTNGKSQLWIKYEKNDGLYKITDITCGNKKRGKTRVRAFRNYTEIKLMMDYFREHNQYDHFLTMMFSLLTGRRVGDTLSLKLSHIFYENGQKRDFITTLEEEKTDKYMTLKISGALWGYIDWYLDKTGITPKNNINGDLFPTDKKQFLYQTKNVKFQKEYKNAMEKALDSQESSYRYAFKKAADANGIKDVSTHTPRKSFGYWAHKLNPQDVDNLDVLQTIFGHASRETTKIYIDEIPEKGEKIFEQVGNFVSDIDNGIEPEINNSPILSIKTSDLRDLFIMACDESIKGRDKTDILNELYSIAESVAV